MQAPPHREQGVNEWFDELENVANGLYSHQMWTQLNHSRFQSDTTIIKTWKWGKVFWKNAVHSSRRVQRMYNKEHWTSVVVAEHLTKTLHVVCPLMCHPPICDKASATVVLWGHDPVKRPVFMLSMCCSWTLVSHIGATHGEETLKLTVACRKTAEHPRKWKNNY